MKEELNLQCPYKVFVNRDKFEYSFLTKSGVTYTLIFFETSSYFGSNATKDGVKTIYSTTLFKDTNSISILDFGIQKTIQAIFSYFFENKENSLIYICDYIDNKQEKRKKRFDRWYENFEDKGILNKIDYEINSEGQINYSSLIYHIVNPYAESISEIIYEFIETLNK